MSQATVESQRASTVVAVKPKELKAQVQHATARELALKYVHSIKGKTVLITGASPDSLGAEFATAIAASSPGMIILAGRSVQSLEKTATGIKAVNPCTIVPVVKIELDSLESVRQASGEINRWVSKIDVLVLSAGIMAIPYELTTDGFEKHFRTNHLGQYLLANLLLPKLLAADRGARIVTVTSAAHHISPVLFDDLSFGNGERYHKWLAYGSSKTANALFALELASRLKQRDIMAFAVNPGTAAPIGGPNADGTGIVGIGRHLNLDELKKMGVGIVNGEVHLEPPEAFKTVGQAAASHVFAAFDPEIAENSGSYVSDIRVANDLASPHARDPTAAKKLWELSEKMIGQSFDW